MKLEYLFYLLEIDRLGSISAAAKSLRLRQSTLSSALKSVEREMGFPLFQRVPTGVEVTPTGKQFMELAREAQHRYDELRSLKAGSSARRRQITLLLAPSVISCAAISLTDAFYKYDVGGQLIFEECNSHTVYQRIFSRSASVGIACLTLDQIRQFQQEQLNDGIAVEPLMQDYLHLLVSRSHRLAGQPYVSVEALANERLATFFKDSPNDAIMGSVIRNWSHFTVYSDINIAMSAVIQQGMIAVLPRYTLLAGPEVWHQQVCSVPLLDTSRNNHLIFYLIYRMDEGLHYQENILLNCVRSYFKGLTERYPEFSLLEGGSGLCSLNI